MPYCNYNKGYLGGISRLRGHSVIRVIEMVSEKRERRRETVLVPGPSERSEREEANTSGQREERTGARVFLGRRRTRNHVGDKVSGYCVSDRAVEPEEDR